MYRYKNSVAERNATNSVYDIIIEMSDSNVRDAHMTLFVLRSREIHYDPSDGFRDVSKTTNFQV